MRQSSQEQLEAHRIFGFARLSFEKSCGATDAVQYDLCKYDELSTPCFYTDLNKYRINMKHFISNLQKSTFFKSIVALTSSMHATFVKQT